LNITYSNVSNFDLRSSDVFDVFTFHYLIIKVILYVIFQVCCGGSLCEKYGRWYTSPIIGKNGLTITISVNSSCVDKQITGIRYLWRDTPCDFKKAAIYSSTDPDLPSPPYFKYFN
jgi:sialate O-acetylesterase